MKTFPLTIFKDVRANAKRERPVTFLELFKLINTTSAASKDKLPLLSLKTFGHKRTEKGSLRHDDNVTTIYGVEVDYDGEEIPFDEAVATIERADLKAILYTTPSHTPAKPRWRILLPTSRGLPPDQRDKLVARVNGLFAGRLAGESFTLSQSFYFGRVKGVPFTLKACDGNEFIPGDCIDRRADLDARAVYSRKPDTTQFVEDADIDWDKVDDHRDLTLPNGASPKLKTIWEWPDDLDMSLDRLNKQLGTQYGSKNSVTLALATLLKAEGWPREKVAAALMDDRPCNEHVWKHDDDADRRRVAQRAVNRSFEPLVFRSDPSKSAGLLQTRLEKPVVHFGKDWYEWTGTYYEPYPETGIDKHVKEFLEQSKTKRSLRDGKLSDVAELFKPKPEDVANVRKMLMLHPEVHIGRGTPPMWLGGKHERPNEYLLSFTNGLLRISPKGECTLLDHTPDYFNLSTVSYAYDPHAPHPKRWLRFLGEVLDNDRESITLTQEIFGLALSGDRSFHAISWSIGASGSGKSVLMSVLIALVGVHNTASLHIPDLGKDFGLESAIGKRLAVFPDERFEGAHYDKNAPIVSELLSISGGDYVRTKQKYKGNWQGMFEGHIHINSNDVLRLRDESGALMRRIALLDFRREIPLAKQDKTLKQKLEKELPGIFNWAMEGYRNLKKRGHLVMPKRNEEKLSIIRNQFSRVTAFVERHCVVGPEHTVFLDDLFEVYRKDCEDKGVLITDTKDSFSQKLSSAYPAVVSKRTHREGMQVRRYEGLGLIK